MSFIARLSHPRVRSALPVPTACVCDARRRRGGAADTQRVCGGRVWIDDEKR